MKRLAALFSALAVLFLLWSGWMLVRPHPGIMARLPEFPTRPGQGGYVPQTGPEEPARLTSPIERILVEKAARRMTVFQQDGPPKTFRVALGSSPRGDKSRQGDGRTPEGVFRIDRLNDRSRFHLSLGIDYPQRRHREAARKAGIDPGGDIMIHGQPNQIPKGYRVRGDWTEGCIAILDDEIEEIYALARIGTEVEIRP
ncbi:L,D-transpeptidase family protein [Paracoccus sp. CPCC 101403]|uniref:L,D-transpeptidase family protein n=2 Tax=Paracoccus broussonetiae TaxID=3075834 RepID=A0ABU3E8Q2_9RHOB|nr:L,D-transpeptidase family protein [Paracoccus sp. CPCC 101403]MDT1060550.1 L,D-transpeptidase family protein [Paracoccus sp. CPCC 101403]